MKLNLPTWSNLAGLLCAMVFAAGLVNGKAQAAPTYATFPLGFFEVSPGVLTYAEVSPGFSGTDPGSTLSLSYDPSHPTRIMIPAGVTRVRLSGTVCWGAGGGNVTSRLVEVIGNGAAVSASFTTSGAGGVAGSFPFSNIVTPIVSVQPGDYLEVRLGFEGTETTWIQGDESYWTLEVW